MLILATIYPATKRLTESLHPVTVSFFRYFLGTAAMIPLYLVERRRRPRVVPTDLLSLSFLGAVGIALFSVCLTLGVRYSTASNGSLLVNSQPIFTTLLAPLIINEDFTPLRLLGALAGIAGVYLVVTGGKALGSILGQEHFTGNLILVGAAVSISLSTIFLKRYVIRYGGFLPTFLTMLAGTVVLIPAAFAFTRGRPLAGLSLSHLPLLAYIGIVCTALVYPLFNRALRAHGVVRAVGFKLLIPVFGIALSMLLLHERPGWATFLGAAVVIGAVLLIQTVRAPRPGMLAARRTGRPRRRGVA
jgi:drug/metabolite transporter (DMT)-like permease